MDNDARSAAAAAGDSPVLEAGARLGYAASGVLHLVIAWIAVQLAWFGGGAEADQSGALNALARTGLGSAPLWVAIVGFTLLALWQVTEVIGRRDVGARLKSAAKAVLYLALAWSTLAVVRGSGSSSSQQSVDFTASLMDRPFGRTLVGLVGAAVIVVGGYHVVKGARATFLEDLRGHPGTWAVRAGRFGYAAKGVALVVVGALFVSAAVARRPEQAQGLDGALRTLLEAPFGAPLLTIVGLGLAAFGGYSFVRARYARV